MTVTAQTGMQAFALPMRAGHFYTIEVLTQMETTIAGSLEIRTVETDATGQQTSVFARATNHAELDNCRNSASSSAAASGT